MKRGRKVGWESSKTQKGEKNISLIDIAWAAGFLEGEGSFIINKGSGQISGYNTDIEVLDKLRKMFGGRIVSKSQYFSTFESRKEYFQWYCSGSRARGIMMTIFSFMSVRRKEQIKKVLEKKGVE